MITIRRAEVADAAPFAAHMRAEDRAECAALGDPVRVVVHSIVNSWAAWCAVEDGLPIAIWGCADDSTGIQLWCLTGDGVARHRRRMLGENLRFIRSFYGFRTHAFVSEDYRRARKWLAWLGFVETSRINLGNHTFIRVEHDGSVSNRRVCIERIWVNSGRHEAERAGSAERPDCDAERSNGGATGRR